MPIQFNDKFDRIAQRGKPKKTNRGLSSNFQDLTRSRFETSKKPKAKRPGTMSRLGSAISKIPGALADIPGKLLDVIENQSSPTYDFNKAARNFENLVINRLPQAASKVGPAISAIPEKVSSIVRGSKPAAKAAQGSASPSSPGLMMRNVPKPGLNLPDMSFVGPVGRSKPKEAAPVKTETPSIKPAATGMGDVRRAEASKTRPVGAESARNLVYKNGMWYENGRVVRGPSIRALKANLKNRGVDAVRDSLENVYGSIEGDAFIKRATGFSADDPILSEAVKAYRTQSSNPTMPSVHRPNFADSVAKGASYTDRTTRNRLFGSSPTGKTEGVIVPPTMGLSPSQAGPTNLERQNRKFDAIQSDLDFNNNLMTKYRNDLAAAREQSRKNIAAFPDPNRPLFPMEEVPYQGTASWEGPGDSMLGPGRFAPVQSEPDPFVGPPAPVGPPDPFFIPRGTNPNIQMFRGAGLRPYLDRLQSRRFGALEDFLSHG